MNQYRAINWDNSANGFSGWIEFEAENDKEAYAHARNVFCDAFENFTLEKLGVWGEYANVD